MTSNEPMLMGSRAPTSTQPKGSLVQASGGPDVPPQAAAMSPSTVTTTRTPLRLSFLMCSLPPCCSGLKPTWPSQRAARITITRPIRIADGLLSRSGGRLLARLPAGERGAVAGDDQSGYLHHPAATGLQCGLVGGVGSSS